MASSTIFITAADARQNPIRETVIHDEARAIESAILDAVKNGFYQATLTNGSPMTSSASVNLAVNNIDLNNDQLYIPNHPFKNGDMVMVSSNGTLPSPLSSTNYYWVIYIDTNHIKLAISSPAASDNIPISIDFTVGITDVTLDDTGSGYLITPRVTIDSSATGVQATAVAYLESWGSIDSISVLSPGQGFTAVPSVSLDAQGYGAIAGTISFTTVAVGIAAGGVDYRVGDILSIVGGTGVAATVTVNTVSMTGAVESITLGNPGLYTVLPTLSAVDTSVQPTGGAGCTLNLTMGLGNITVLNGGFGYTASPAVTISNGNGIGATATAIINAGNVVEFKILTAGSGYTTTPTIDIDSGSGTVAAAVLQPTGVGSFTVIDDGGDTYTTIPNVNIVAYGSGATVGTITMRVVQTVLTNSGTGYLEGDTVLVAGGSGTYNASILITKVGTFGEILNYTLVTSGSYTYLPILQNNSVLGGNGHAATFNLTVGLLGIEIDNPGSGYLSSPIVTISPSDNNGYGATAYATLTNDTVGSIVVTSAGNSYTAMPTITISSGAGATAEAKLAETSIASIEMDTIGSGYTYANIRILGDGQGAHAYAIISGDAIANIIVDAVGNGYTYPPQIIIDGDGINASAHAVLTPTHIASVQIVDFGSNYTNPPNVTIDGAATVRANLKPTGISRLDVIEGGTHWSSLPIVQVIPNPDQVGTVVAPSASVNIGYSLASIVVTNAGAGYNSLPVVHITAPQGLNGTQASATAALGAGTGTLVVSQYPTSKDYYKIWKNQVPSDNLYVRPYTERMDTVIAYFTSLGYTISRQTNTITGNTIQWSIMW